MALWTLNLQLSKRKHFKNWPLSKARILLTDSAYQGILFTALIKNLPAINPIPGNWETGNLVLKHSFQIAEERNSIAQTLIKVSDRCLQRFFCKDGHLTAGVLSCRSHNENVISLAISVLSFQTFWGSMSAQMFLCLSSLKAQPVWYSVMRAQGTELTVTLHNCAACESSWGSPRSGMHSWEISPAPATAPVPTHPPQSLQAHHNWRHPVDLDGKFKTSLSSTYKSLCGSQIAHWG